MKKLLVLSLLLMFACDRDTKEENLLADSSAKEIIANQLAVYDYNGIEQFLTATDDKVHVVNFWATWCKPCIKELPYFEEVNANYDKKDVEVLLISLDFPQQFEKRLIPYINENNLKSKIIALDDPDMNRWIPMVDESWTGAIPATIIYTKNKRQFYERSFTYEELESEIKQFLK